MTTETINVDGKEVTFDRLTVANLAMGDLPAIVNLADHMISNYTRMTARILYREGEQRLKHGTLPKRYNRSVDEYVRVKLLERTRNYIARARERKK